MAPLSNPSEELDEIARKFHIGDLVIARLSLFVTEIADERDRGVPARAHPLVRDFLRDIEKIMRS